MAIAREVLNTQADVSVIRTGVFQSAQRRIAAVVKVDRKAGKVYYLQEEDCLVKLVHSYIDPFVRNYPIELPNYPVRRAVRAFHRHILDGYKYTEEARRVINTILER